MNIPYKKKYDKNGVVVNPIKSNYMSNEPNRSERRKKLQKKRFHGESKNFHLSVFNNMKYHRFRQVIILKDGRSKTIEHYVPR